LIAADKKFAPGIISAVQNFRGATILMANLRQISGSCKRRSGAPAERMRQLKLEMILFRYCLVGAVMTRFRRHNAGSDHAPLT
jgi:hypothetical protein